MKLLNCFCIALAIGLLSSSNSVAQFFNTASQVELAMTETVNSRKTGNDFILDGTDKIEFSVWDEGNGPSKAGYQINNGGQIILQLTCSTAVDPDVCLIKDGNNDIHAIVVFYDAVGNDYILEAYDYSGGTFSLQGSAFNIRANVSFGTAVNIDADDTYNFMVIWDDSNAGKLHAIAGDHSGSTINFTNTPVTVGSSPNHEGYYPDVCLYGGTTNRVTFTYILSNELYVDIDDVTAIAGGNGTGVSNILNDNNAIATYLCPRIACPNSNTGTVDDWTVVFMDTDNSTRYNICGFTYNASVNPMQIYNDGSAFSPLDISSFNNFEPVVSYDNHSPYGIYVGWMHENISPYSGLSANNATIPIVISCDDFGQVINGVDYMEVSYSPGSGDYDIGLSLSGRNGNDWLFITFAKDVAADIYTKSINPISTATSLRNINNFQTPVDRNQLFENVSNVKVIDLQGKMIYEKQNFNNDMLNSLNNELVSKRKGMYIFIINYENGEQATYKLASLLD